MYELVKAKIKNLDEHSKEVFIKTSSSAIVKMSGVLVAVIISAYLGRKIGPDGLGIIDLSIRISSFLLMFSIFGMSQVLVKNIAIAKESNDSQTIADYIRTSIIFNGILSIIICTFFFFLVPIICVNLLHIQELVIPLQIAIIVVIPQTFSQIFAAGLNGFKKVWQSNLVNQSLSSWLIGIGLLTMHVFNWEIDVINVAVAYGISRIIVCIVVFSYWKSLFRFNSKFNFSLKKMIRPALSLFLVSSTSILAANTDSIMLAWLSELKEVGIYSVAIRLSTFMIFFLQISNSAISPKLAALFANRSIDEMQLMVNKVTKVLIFVAATLLIGFVIFGELLLSFWGNPTFQDGYWVLIILCIGQFVNISTGCSGMLLVMCGREKVHGYISLFSLFLNIALNLLFISYFGIIGAAIATSLTIILENVLKVIYAQKYIGILTIPKFN